MPSFEVRQRGTDTSGRPIYATDYFWRVWTAVLASEAVAPFAHLVVVVQGAFMSRLGGGAVASAGYHDLGGCIDVRTWNLTAAQQQTLWDAAWEHGICFWKRDYPAHMGRMDPHGHGVAGWDKPLAGGATYQWIQARSGRNGLANNAVDYMRRPTKPLPTEPPARLLRKDYLMTDAAKAQLDRIDKRTDLILGRLNEGLKGERIRDREAARKARESKAELVAALGGLADQLGAIADAAADDATKGNVRQAKNQILAALAADPDVDGPDNPAPEEKA